MKIVNSKRIFYSNAKFNIQPVLRRLTPNNNKTDGFYRSKNISNNLSFNGIEHEIIDKRTAYLKENYPDIKEDYPAILAKLNDSQYDKTIESLNQGKMNVYAAEEICSLNDEQRQFAFELAEADFMNNSIAKNIPSIPQ